MRGTAAPRLCDNPHIHANRMLLDSFLTAPPESRMAGTALRVPGFDPARRAGVQVEYFVAHPPGAAAARAPRHPIAAMPPCPLSCPPLCHLSAN